MRQWLSKWMSENALSAPPCRTLLDSAPPLGPITSDIEAYHIARKTDRAHLIEALNADLGGVETFMSVGAGAAGEESLVNCKQLVLIEPDERFAAYLRVKHPFATVICQPYESLVAPADVIYAASLGPWMLADPTRGVEAGFVAFCRRNLKPGGAVVALIYGGMHTAYILDRRHYLERLLECGFHVALYGRYRASNAMLVLTESPRLFPKLTQRLDVLIEDGCILKHAGPSARMAAWCAVVIHTLRNVRRVFREALYLLRINERLRR